MEFQIKSLSENIDKGVVYLDAEGKITGYNGFYKDNYRINILKESKVSLLSTSLLSSEQKSKLSSDGKVKTEVVLNPKSGEISKFLPSGRLISNRYLEMNFLSITNDKQRVVGYLIIISELTNSFNDNIDRLERDESWRNISLLGREAFFQYDVNTARWIISDNFTELTGSERDIKSFLKLLNKSDKKMIMELWSLSLAESRQGDIFEYTFEMMVGNENRYFSARWTLNVNDSSNPVVFGLMMDITQLTKTETALGESLTQMSLLSLVEDIVLWSFKVDENLFIVNTDVSSPALLKEFNVPTEPCDIRIIFELFGGTEHIYKIWKEYKSLVKGEISSINLKSRIKNQKDNFIFVTTNFVIQKSDAKNNPILILGLTRIESPSELETRQELIKRNNMEEEKKTILIAEDIDNNYDLLNIILRKEYKLVRAVNGLEAVRLFSEVKPDIILMDMKMPEMGGLEATKLIRMESSDVPIIAVTAFAFESDREVALEAGCNDFLSKPIDIPVLKSLIKKYLGIA